MTDEDANDDLFFDAAPNPVSMLDEIKKDLQVVITKPSITLKVETRDRWSVKYNPNIDGYQLDMWRGRCRRKGHRDEIDALKFASIVVNNTCEQLYFRTNDGDIVAATDTDGNPMTVRSHEFTTMLGAIDSASAIRKFFGLDSHLLAHAGKVLSTAGYDEEGMEVSEDDSPLD